MHACMACRVVSIGKLWGNANEGYLRVCSGWGKICHEW